MARAGKLFTIPAGVSFVNALAEGVLAEHGDTPLSLSGVTLLLPTRRAVRSLREAFLRLSSGPMLLPTMSAIGDVDEDELALSEDNDTGEIALDCPPAIGELERQLLLAQLIRQWESGRAGARSNQGQAVRLAGELARLIDQVQTARLDFAGLKTLVEGDLAEHWQQTLHFLRIVTEAWPSLLASRHGIDPAERRNRMLAALASHWQEHPPEIPVIAAGSTGSVPATADLLAVVATLPQGSIVLPGLDRGLDDESWRALGETHPQFGMAQLLERLGIEREDVQAWPWGGGGDDDRAALAREVMRPEATAHAWADLAYLDAVAATSGLSRIDCSDSRAEAGVVALLMRETMEQPGRTAALVTPDRDLARRVRAELGRWNITVDDSAGRPLAKTIPGTFLRLTLDALREELAPVPLLSLLKHPLAAGAEKRAAFRARARELERACLRGPRPGPGFAGLHRALGDYKSLRAWLRPLEEAATPLLRRLKRTRPVALTDLVHDHLVFAEWLASDDEQDGAGALWQGEAGSVAAALFEQLLATAEDLHAISAAEYPALIEALLARAVVRPHAGVHPRLAIWGPLEARLQHADRIILGGLVEASWPGEVTANPWLSRPMRHSFGLPLSERAVGLAAHDFAQLFCAPEVVLTRAEKVDGTPTVPSRWLVRLDTVLEGVSGAGIIRDPLWQQWYNALDAPEGPPQPLPPPEPRPPVAARPRRLSVTHIERWMRDPYDIFAQHILGLEALDPIDATLGPTQFGRYIHHALHEFISRTSEPFPDDAEDRLLKIGRQAMVEAEAYPGLWAFLWPRFERIAKWFLAREGERRGAGLVSHTEIVGSLNLSRAEPFSVSAKADRIDLDGEGKAHIIDYKTGGVPSETEVAAGFAPQLPLEAAIALAGGFPGLSVHGLGPLAYWHIGGGREVGTIRALKHDASELAAEAVAGLNKLVTAFDQDQTPYIARPTPAAAPSYSDYQHLARVGEWSATEREGR